MVTWPVCPGEEPIAAYVAGRLERAERDAIDAHLDTCSACSELVAALAKAGMEEARAASAVTASPSLGGSEPASDDRLLAGQLGRFVLLSRLGAGGMGIVYAAYDPELDRRVALKVLKPPRHDDPAGLGAEASRLRDEARAIAKLAHPNVVAVFDVGRVADTTFIAMELVDGPTLREWLAAEARTTDQILRVFRDAGRGLVAAHAEGLVHRDFKPANIMLGRDGRARVLDFGLASPVGADAHGGTPAYMAPEQTRGGAVDARADQYAFCVALWEALTGERPNTTPDATSAPKPDVTIDRTIDRTIGAVKAGVPPEVVAAVHRGLSTDPAARWPSMDALLAELEPSPSRRHLPWVAAAFAVVGVAVAGGAAVSAREARVEPCARAGAPVDAAWNATPQAAIRSAFVATRAPFAGVAAASLIRQLDGWSERWRVGAEATCRATSIENVQPAAIHAMRQGCLDRALDRLKPIVALAANADIATVVHADELVGSLPAPERCADATLLAAVTPPGEDIRDEVHTLETHAAALEAGMIAGRREVADQVRALVARAGALAYPPLDARAAFLDARLANTTGHFSDAIAKLHAAARHATAARDLELLAEIWIELVKSLGNDLRTTAEADTFDGYVAALIPQLPDREQLGLELDHARCARNPAHGDDVKKVAASCEAAIAAARRAKPPLLALAIADEVRLGHFQRLLGDPRSMTTLRSAVDESVQTLGKDHPDTSIAHYALGMALLSTEKTDDLAAGIAELRTALEIRRVAYPDGGPVLAEALQGLGDALASAGRHDEAMPYFTEGLAALDRAGAGTTIQAVQLHILAGMSLEELKRRDDALAHDLAAADLADKLEHRADLVAMALRLAAGIESDGKPALALVHAERALRALEQAHESAAAIGKTQLLVAQLADATHDRARARAMAEAALASLASAGPAGAEDLADAKVFAAKLR